MNSEPEIVMRSPYDARPAGETPPPQPDRAKRRRQLRVSIVLFALTMGTAMCSQVPREPGESLWDLVRIPFVDPGRLLVGLPFAVTLMTILLAHEMGHFLTARRYGVDQSPPFFIPAPTLFGTFGALILMRSQPPNRRVLFNVAVIGPLAGLLLAIPAAAWGLYHSIPAADGQYVPTGTAIYGSSLLFSLLKYLFGPESNDVALHQVGLAGWVGMFVTSLNLMPAAQLDGGHIAYAMFGKRHEKISLAVVVSLLAIGFYTSIVDHAEVDRAAGGMMWIMWAFLLFIIGIRHPPVQDETIILTRTQRATGIVALLLFIATFIPVPVRILGAAPDTPSSLEERQPRSGRHGPSKRQVDEDAEPSERSEPSEPYTGPAEEFRL